MTEEDQFRNALYRTFPLTKGAKCTGSGMALSTRTRDYSFLKAGVQYFVERQEGKEEFQIWTYKEKGIGKRTKAKTAKKTAPKARRKA